MIAKLRRTVSFAQHNNDQTQSPKQTMWATINNETNNKRTTALERSHEGAIKAKQPAEITITICWF